MPNLGLISLASAALDMEEEDYINGACSQEEMIKVPERNSRGNAFDPFTSQGGGDFTPHIFTVNPNEDIIERIASLTKNGSREICVLSANGEVRNFKIQPVGVEDELLNFEDAYELISLKGSILINECGGVKNEPRGWQISVCGSNGGFYVGRLVGKLIAATPVQIVVGSFLPLVAYPSQTRSEKFTSVVVTPNPSTFTSTGQIQHPETSESSQYYILESSQIDLNL